MGVTEDNQAMTEVALGLAMAFFAMMILAMISMSVPLQEPLAVKSKPMMPIDTAIGVVESRPVQRERQDTALNIDNNPMIIIFYQGRFLDTTLQTVDVGALAMDQHYVLALSPDLSLKAALEARAQISVPNLLITELNAAWLARLAL